MIGKQRKWSSQELIELIRMDGLISAKSQAKYLGRSQFSRKRAMTTHFNLGVNALTHGLPRAKAHLLVNDGAEHLYINSKFRYLCLWVEMERHLKPSVPDFVRDSVTAMANFQRWLYECDDVLQAVKRMIAEREICD